MKKTIIIDRQTLQYLTMIKGDVGEAVSEVLAETNYMDDEFVITIESQ